MTLNESQETVRFKIMINPLNRAKVWKAAEELYNTKISKCIRHDGEPLLSTITELVRKEGSDLTVEERATLEVAMYMNEIRNFG